MLLAKLCFAHSFRRAEVGNEIASASAFPNEIWEREKMRIVRLTLIAVMFGISLTRLFGDGSPPDFNFIDGYLANWNRFAQGENELVPTLKKDKGQFLDELTKAVSANDKRAMSRVVFYDVVQVGGFIPYDSPLGKAVEKVVGSQVAIFTSKTGEKSYFAGDLYFWWEDHKSAYETFPLYEQYVKTDFAKQTVIPMYTAAAKKSGPLNSDKPELT